MARCDDPSGAAARLLPDRMGAPGAEPQRVLRPPRGRTQSQRSGSSNERACDGPGPLGKRRLGALVPRTATARCRTRASLGGDRWERSGTARGTHCPHRRISRRGAALSLRAPRRGTCRSGRPGCGGRSGTTHPLRHVAGVLGHLQGVLGDRPSAVRRQPGDLSRLWAALQKVTKSSTLCTFSGPRTAPKGAFQKSESSWLPPLTYAYGIG